ncbi:hypothetical protein [Laribacter hongkongensis]|uniref:hypothetical protein n=1 Tax=Laribacter hongkongensis TaxID=168471 RepID=UPI00117F5196|nr:hypothetical protein [Laribacter hongkongensis]
MLHQIGLNGVSHTHARLIPHGIRAFAGHSVCPLARQVIQPSLLLLQLTSGQICRRQPQVGRQAAEMLGASQLFCKMAGRNRQVAPQGQCFGVILGAHLFGDHGRIKAGILEVLPEATGIHEHGRHRAVRRQFVHQVPETFRHALPQPGLPGGIGQPLEKGLAFLLPPYPVTVQCPVSALDDRGLRPGRYDGSHEGLIGSRGPIRQILGKWPVRIEDCPLVQILKGSSDLFCPCLVPQLARQHFFPVDPFLQVTKQPAGRNFLGQVFHGAIRETIHGRHSGRSSRIAGLTVGAPTGNPCEWCQHQCGVTGHDGSGSHGKGLGNRLHARVDAIQRQPVVVPHQGIGLVILDPAHPGKRLGPSGHPRPLAKHPDRPVRL